MLEAVGAPDMAPGGPRYRDLQGVVQKGLRAWDRKVLRAGMGRGFLVSLACEGGLPLKLVLREQSSLRRFFKALLEEFRLFDKSDISPTALARRVSRHLPRSLRQEVVYKLSGDLVAEVWSLQSQVSDEDDPLVALDSQRPDWRQGLPLRVGDRVARTFLNNLLNDAADVARRGALRIKYVRYVRQLDQSDDWELLGRYELPRTLRQEDVRRLFDLDSQHPVPSRLDLLSRQDVDDLELLGIGVDRPGPDHRRVIVVEETSRSRVEHRGQVVAAGRTLVLRSRELYRESAVMPGTFPLSDLPWVFVPDVPDEESCNTYRLAGQGGVCVREPEALIVVPGEVEPRRGDEKAKVSLVGQLSSLGRCVYHVGGRIDVALPDDGRVTVETGAGIDTARPQRVLVGRSVNLGRGDQRQYLGRPRLQERLDGTVVREVKDSELKWKPDMPGGAWRAYAQGAVGRGFLRHVVDGNTLFSEGITILPSTFRIRYEPLRQAAAGRLEVHGAGGGLARLIGPEGVTAERVTDADKQILKIRASGGVPANVKLMVDWGERGRAILSVPFPAFQAGFLKPNGHRVNPGAKVSIGKVGALRAFAVAPSEDSHFHLDLS